MLFARKRIALALMLAVPVMAVAASQSAYAQTFQTIYIRDMPGQSGGGTGAQTAPFGSFESALNYARQNPGTTIKLLNNVVVSRYTEVNGRIQPMNLGDVTIDGDGHTLTVRGAPLSLTGNTVIKNINLELPSIDNTISLDVAAEAAREKDQFIYLNGNRLELDNVRTQTGTNPLSRPTIVLGNGADTAGDAGRAELVLKNTTVKHIVAGNLNGQTKTSHSNIHIDSGSEVIGDVFFGAPGHKVTGAVNVVSQTQKVGSYIGGDSDNNTLEIKGVNAYRETLIDGVQNLKLTDNTDLMVNKLNITGTLTLAEGTRINAEPAADNRITIGNLDAQGRNEIRFTSNNTVAVTGNLSGNASLKIKGETELNKVYVTVGSQTGTLDLTAPDNRTAMAFTQENGRYRATAAATQNRWQGAPVISFSTDQNRDGRLTEDEGAAQTATASVSLPQGTQAGDWVLVTVTTTRNGVPAETTEDIEVTADMLRTGAATLTLQTGNAEQIAVDAYLDDGAGKMSDEAQRRAVIIDHTPTAPPGKPEQKSGSGATEPAKPTITIENKKGPATIEAAKPFVTIDQKKGNGLTQSTLPEPNFSQKGIGSVSIEKPAIEIKNQKGKSLREAEKPEATIAVQQKGNGLTQPEKPEIAIQQKGSGVTAPEKPEIVIQQKGSGTSEPEKPTAEIPAEPGKATADIPEQTEKEPSDPETAQTRMLNLSLNLEELNPFAGMANAVVLNTADSITQAITARQIQPTTNERNVWAKTIGNRHKNHSRFAYQTQQNAIVIGGDNSGENHRIGLAGAYSQDHADMGFARQKWRNQSWHGLLYGDYRISRAQIDFIAGGFYGQTDSERRSLSDSSQAKADYRFHGAQAGLGISFQTGRFTPFARADYTRLWLRSYREYGQAA